MCENEKMTDDIKVMHSQHVRILKEDDEIWISSEDLNTENSSDDDRSKTKLASKKRMKLKYRKRSSPNIKLQRPSVPSVTSVPGTSKDLDSRLLMPASENSHCRSTDESRTSDEELSMPPVLSECLSKRLSLEDWRPTRGSLSISPLEETSSTPGGTNEMSYETDNFYGAMFNKLKSLKSRSTIKMRSKESLDLDEYFPVEKNTFKYLKNTPEVRRKLDFIYKLDHELRETIIQYKMERDARLVTEFELCKNISEHKVTEDWGCQKFLEICGFDQEKMGKIDEKEQKDDIAECAEVDIVKDLPLEQKHETIHEGTANFVDFVRKNTNAARQGVMASFSLTDEEKTRIADILKDIDEFQLDDVELSLSSTSLTEEPKSCNNSVDLKVTNAYCLSEAERLRILAIDSELQKFDDTHTTEDTLKKDIQIVKDEEFWRQFALEQSLKEIDAKLEKLYISYAEDQETLKHIYASRDSEDLTTDQIVVNTESNDNNVKEM